MKQIHQQEKEQFKQLFLQEKLDNFEDRYRILDVFLQIENHVTLEEFIEVLKDKGVDFEESFVKQTLDLMCYFGFAQRNRFNNGLVRYEHRHLGQHHDHMICIKCDRILEFEDSDMEALQIRISGRHGFHILQHKMELYGLCSQCFPKQQASISLVMAKQGQRLIIREFTGGTTTRLRMRAMGLRVGDEIEVITNSSKGQVVIAADRTRFALGRGLAEKIQVEAVQ